MAASYANLDAPNTGNTPYGSGAPYYAQSTGFISPAEPPRKRTSNWIKIGVPVILLVIVAGVVGGVLATRHKSSASSSSASSGGSGAADSPAAASAAISAKNAVGLFATATNSFYMMPVYPSTTNTAVYGTPTYGGASAWPTDSFQPANPAPTAVRPDRPRIIAPSYKWQALPALIAKDPYLASWNATIFQNATDFYNAVPVVYNMDRSPHESSGILDNARQTKERMKAWGYAYRMSNNTKWVDRAWTEIQNSVGNGTAPFGPNDDTRWNPAHFLDTAEFTSAFGIAYDWMYDAWTADQKGAIRSAMITYGLDQAINSWTNSTNYNGWWKNTGIYGNWNCVCNGGLTIGALAILGDDTTGTAETILATTVPNANENCVFAPSSDGTWAETPNYWYFGTTGHAEMTSALLTATGSDFNLLKTNPNLWRTGYYHMYSAGPTSQFNWGDHGPNKFSTTANSMLLYGKEFNIPQFALFQRDQWDVADPWSMFWYDPSITGAYWNGLALDHLFENTTDQWAAMRSSWTDMNALYVGIKAPMLLNHQTHGDLDVGDFVLDAMGQRWAGEFGSANYLGTDYFSNETQTSSRWSYYRKRTEGQNTIVVGHQNQNINAAPVLLGFGTTNETQGSSTVYDVPSTSTAFFAANLASAYFNVSSFNRGIRMINGRKQVLLQDDITASDTVTWIMHTNATITIDSSGTSATLTLNGQTLIVQLMNAPSGAKFTQSASVRFTDDSETVPQTTDTVQQAENNDQVNPNESQLMIALPAGTYTLAVLFNPQWPGMSSSDFKTPPSVDVAKWTLHSHD